MPIIPRGGYRSKWFGFGSYWLLTDNFWLNGFLTDTGPIRILIEVIGDNGTRLNGLVKQLTGSKSNLLQSSVFSNPQAPKRQKLLNL
jgi:hypothetical protein